ncbi:MAG: hypothetical protein JWP17_669 [Solirubrobacterales bacterium]|jgi:hypothetical protein|nr:hypothetical protein [Solirubrobacterales bacterium]
MRRASGGIGVIDTAAVMLCLPGAAVAAGEQSGAMPVQSVKVFNVDGRVKVDVISDTDTTDATVEELDADPPVWRYHHVGYSTGLACDVENNHVGHSRDIRGYLASTGK